MPKKGIEVGLYQNQYLMPKEEEKKEKNPDKTGGAPQNVA